MKAPGLGESQRAILEALKRQGPLSVPELSRELGLNVETLRGHLRVLAGHGLVRRESLRRAGRGRPLLLYALSAKAEQLFPRRESEVLQALVQHLDDAGHAELLRVFFERYIGAQREPALARVAGLSGRARLEEAARVLSELGFMAEVVEEEGGVRLRLCHCPLRELVQVTRAPCGAEVGFVRELLGEPLARESYMPAGGWSCSYRVGEA